MDNKDKLIDELSAEYGIKKESKNNSNFQYIADTNSLYRKSKMQQAGPYNMEQSKSEIKTFEVPLEKEEYIKVLNEETCMLIILDNGVQVGHVIKVVEHEAFVVTGHFVIKEVAEIIHGSEGGPLSPRFCVVRLK